MGKQTATWSATLGVAVTPHASTNISPPNSRVLYIGVGGDVEVVWQDDTTSIFKGVAAGEFLMVQAKRVNAASTTATNILALY